MSITTSISTRFIPATLLFLCVFGSFACQQIKSETLKNTQTSSQEKVQKEIEEEAERIQLNPKNAIDFLDEYGNKNKESILTMHTAFGDIKIRLYTNTPLHRANMLYLNSMNYFDGTWVHRVSKGHVIQIGNTDEVETVRSRREIGDYKVPAEMLPQNYHKYGAVAAARTYANNPEKASDPYEFYIVLGKSYSRRELKLLAEKHELNFDDAALNFYENRRGSPHLDGEHTVFGEVIEGMSVVEKISRVKVDKGEWPLDNIPVKFSL